MTQAARETADFLPEKEKKAITSARQEAVGWQRWFIPNYRDGGKIAQNLAERDLLEAGTHALNWKGTQVRKILMGEKAHE